MCNGGECPSVPEPARACPTLINKQFGRIAEEKWGSRLSTSAKWNYLEMGLVQLSICVFTGKSGDLRVGM
jgi:hypothetical protein